ncbi:hypothetical protein E3Q05_03281 [Wallemia mellicola]|nr:hypothetical protein E3Q05_03281 [Wallemia mellicola]
MTEPSREILSNSAALNSLKRPQLNRLCKRFGVNAKGKNSELIERLESLASSISKEQLDDYAGAPEESPVKKARTTEPWELIEGVSQSEDIDFNPPSPSKQSSYNSSTQSKSIMRSIGSSIKSKLKEFSPSKQSTVSPSKYQDVVVEMKHDDSSGDESEDEQSQSWNVVPGECQPTRLSTAASIHEDTIVDDTVKLVGNEREPSPSPSFVNRPSLPSQESNTPNKIYPPLPQFVFGQSSVSNAGFTNVMEELNKRLPSAEIKPEIKEQFENANTRKSASELGLKSGTNLKIKRKFDDAHKNEFDKMDSIANHYSARPKISPRKTTSVESPRKVNARPSSGETSQPNKRIRVAAPTQEERERRDDVKRRLELSRQKRRSSMAANARGIPTARPSVGRASVKPPTRIGSASRAAGLIKNVGKKLFGGSANESEKTTNAEPSTSSTTDQKQPKRVVRKLKKPQEVSTRTTSLTKPAPFKFATEKPKPVVAGTSKAAAEPSAQATEAQQRAAERVKMARLKESNKGGKSMTPRRKTNVGSKRPSNAEQVSKARLSQSPIKRRQTRERAE